jgi:hypothetical protein
VIEGINSTNVLICQGFLEMKWIILVEAGSMDQQDLHYTYDKAGEITSLVDSLAVESLSCG